MNKLLNECYSVKEALSFCNCWAETYKNNRCCRGKSCLSDAAVSGLLFRPLLRFCDKLFGVSKLQKIPP